MKDLHQQSLKERSKRILQSINSSVNRSVSDEIFAMYDELRLIAVDSKVSKVYGKKFFGGIDFQQLDARQGCRPKLILPLIRLCHKSLLTYVSNNRSVLFREVITGFINAKNNSTNKKDGKNSSG